MKKTISIGVLVLCLSVGVQAQSGKEKLEAAEREAANERERSLGGKRTANYLKDDQGKVQAAENASGDSTATANEQTEDAKSQGESESGQPADNGNGLMNANEEESNQANNSIGNTKDEEKTSTPAVIQQTSSESGSPSVISQEDGKGRDGTGNVQRATPNMVGSPVPANWNLADKNVNPSNTEAGTQVRQQEEQPSRTGPDREDTGAQGKGDAQAEQKAGENTQADQTDTQVEKDEKPSKQDERKERRKARRNRDKDS